MKLLKPYLRSKQFGNVKAFNFGMGLFGPPYMTVWCFIADGIMIDTGISRMKQQALEIARSCKPESILLTHYHEDHSGNAAAISNDMGIDVFGHPYTVNKLSRPYPIYYYQHLMWGKAFPLRLKPHETIYETGSLRFRPVFTPGHSKDHTVFLEETNGWLFSGDLYIGDKIKYFRTDENFHDQLASLKHINTLDFDSLFCAHRPVMTGGKEAIQRKIDYLEEFSGSVKTLHDKGYSSTEITRTLNTGDDTFVKWITLKNACFSNMVQSALSYVA